MSPLFKPPFCHKNKTVIFQFVIDGVPYNAMISREALSEHFGAGDDPEHWVTTYITNATEIDAVAAGKIRKGSKAPVLVITDDFITDDF